MVEMVQDRDVFTIQIVSDLPSYLPIASLFKCDVWHSCAVIYQLQAFSNAMFGTVVQKLT